MNLRRITSFAGGYPFAVGLIVAVTLVILPFHPDHLPQLTMLVYVVAIVVVSVSTSMWPAIVSAALSFFALDAFVEPPLGPLVPTDVGKSVVVAAFLAGAVLISRLVSAVRERELIAVHRQEELEFLNELTARLVPPRRTSEAAAYAVTELARMFDACRVALYVKRPPSLEPVLVAETGDVSAAADETRLADEVARTGLPIGLSDPLPANLAQARRVAGSSTDCSASRVVYPLGGEGERFGALFIGGRRPPSAADVALLGALSNLATQQLENRTLAAEAARLEAAGEAEGLKSVLVSSVSHELKTPLAALTARITNMLDFEDYPAGLVREQLEASASDLARLNRSITDLVDYARLESDAWQHDFEPSELPDVIGTAVSRLDEASKQRIRYDLHDDGVLVDVDHIQLARALSHLIENALAYSPPEGPVVIGTSLDSLARVWVEDYGPGVPLSERDAIFEKFSRGAASGAVPSGSGLGLTIARDIVKRHGGTIDVEDVDPHGARFVVSLPISHAGG